MVKKLTKHGNSLALVIERPILDLLNISAETALEVTTDGQRLIIAPAAETARAARFQAAQRIAHERFGRAFQKLAE
jgi:antitoxin component of MazEF toxin-antitoxin module